jgi:hypothetical protein
MGTADGQTGLAGMACLLTDAIEHQGTTGNGFRVLVRVDKADE